MATEQAKLIIRGENQTEATFRQVRRSMGELEGAGQKLARTLAGLGAGVSIGLIGRQIGQAVIEAEQSEARLAATLRATGNVTGYTTAQLEELNKELVKLSTFDDEAIRNAQAQIVKFGNISGEQFSRALKLSADYAALLGTDLPNGAQQLGRALTAPNVGLTFLERNVGKFTDATRKSITEMVAMGDTAGAQRLILDELDKRIGGTAETMNTGLTKAAADVKRSWTDMLEALGRTEVVIGSAGSGGVLGFFTKLFKATEEVAQNFDVIKRQFQGDFAARSAITDPALAAIQQREQAARDEAKANADAARERERKAKAIEEEEKAATRRAEQIAQRYQFAQERENQFLANEERVLEALRKEGEEREKLAQAYQEQQDEQAAFHAQSAQERENEFIAAGKLEAALERTDDRAKRSAEAAHDLGLVFVSAFENAIVEGEDLSEVLKALEKDIARIVIRKTITEPGANAIADVVKGIAGSLFDGARASGGPVSGGRAYLVGEDGPELFVPQSSGQVVANGVGGVTIVQHISVDSRSDRASILQAMVAAKEQAKAEIHDSLRRGSNRFR